MSDFPLSHLLDIRTSEDRLYWLDDFLLNIATSDGDATSFSQIDAESHVNFIKTQTQSSDIFFSYKSADDFYNDVTCYLSMRYLSFAKKTSGVLSFTTDEVAPWINSIYMRECNPSCVGRLYGYALYTADKNIKFKDLFPQEPVFANAKKMKEWLQYGEYTENKEIGNTQLPSEESEEPLELSTKKETESETRFYKSSLSKQRLLQNLKDYKNYPKDVRHEVALKNLEALYKVYRAEALQNKNERVAGIGKFVGVIASEERKMGWSRYVDDFMDIYKNQLDIKKTFNNIFTSKGDVTSKLQSFFSFKPVTFVGRVIEYWGKIGRLEKGESKLLMEIVGYIRRGDVVGQIKRVFALDTDFDVSTKCMAIKALGEMEYQNKNEKTGVADYLMSFIENEIHRSDWHRSENVRLVFEAIVSLGKLGITHVGKKSVTRFVARFFYSPLYKKEDLNLEWINLAGLRALTYLYEKSNNEAEKEIIYKTIQSDGLSHECDMTRAFSYSFLRKNR